MKKVVKSNKPIKASYSNNQKIATIRTKLYEAVNLIETLNDEDFKEFEATTGSGYSNLLDMVQNLSNN